VRYFHLSEGKANNDSQQLRVGGKLNVKRVESEQ